MWNYAINVIFGRLVLWSGGEGEVGSMSERLLITDDDFQNCMKSQNKVKVIFFDDEYEGIVENYCNDAVKLSGSYFIRKNSIQSCSKRGALQLTWIS